MISKFAVAALLSVSLLHADAQLPYQKESQTSFQNEVLGQKSPFSEIKIHGKTAGYLEKIDENTVNINDIFYPYISLMDDVSPITIDHKFLEYLKIKKPT